jgi:hypothetical protein
MGELYLKDQPELEIGQFRWVHKPGRYPVTIVTAEEGVSSKGDPKISLRGTVDGGEEFARDNGVSFFDHLICRGASGAYSKKKLRQLGVPVDSDTPISLDQICAHLTGKRIFADLTNEQAFDKGASGDYDVPKMVMDENGKEIRAYSTKATAYYLHNVGGQLGAPAPQVQAPVQQQGFTPPPPQMQQQQAPQGFGPPPGFAPQAGPPQGFPVPQTQAAVAPPGFPQMGTPPGFAPQQAAPNGAPPGFPAQGGMPAPWAQQAQSSAPQAEAAPSGGGRGRGKKNT